MGLRGTRGDHRALSLVQLVAGVLVMLASAAVAVVSLRWFTGVDLYPRELAAFLAVLGALTVFWYALLLLAFPRLQRRGLTAGLATALLVDLSIGLFAGVAYWSAGSPAAKTDMGLGLEASYVFALLGVLLWLGGWRVLLLETLGGWLAERVMRAIPPSRSQP